MSFGWDLPPGVSHSDPHLTGEYPCEDCGATLPEECTHCGGSGDVGPAHASDGMGDKCPYCEDGTPITCPGGCAEPGGEDV